MTLGHQENTAAKAAAKPGSTAAKPGSKVTSIAISSIEISIKGKWIPVPALPVDDRFLIVKGKWLKTAVIEAEHWLETGTENPERYVQALREQASRGFQADLLTFTQREPDTEPRYRYPMKRESMAVARTSNFKDWWTKLPQETRKNVRRAEKRGVTVSVRPLDDNLVRGLVSLNNDSPLRQGKPFTHYGKTFEQVWKDQLSFLDHCDYICAYFEDDLIGVLKLVYRGDSATILTLLSKPSHADKRPSNALLAKAVELCAAKGIAYLVYGQLVYGKKRDSSLKDFKLRHGFEEMLVPRYWVPLTPWGALSLRAGLHQGLVEALPQEAIALALSVRWECSPNRVIDLIQS